MFLDSVKNADKTPTRAVLDRIVKAKKIGCPLKNRFKKYGD